MEVREENTALRCWQIVGLVILSIRFVQGFIFWGGGSRRFIYAPIKLDPYATQWMANKLQSAMPGALLGVSHIISFLLQHFVLLYASIIIFSLVELLSGLALILGCFTRLASIVTILLSMALMIIFGWEGSTCLDEWTMAVANFAMGVTLMLSGASIYSIDSWLLHKYPKLNENNWFLALGSGPWTYHQLKRVGILFLFITVIFTLSTYNYYRGAILSRYHKGPVSAVTHHMTLSNGTLAVTGEVSFTAYVDAGSTAIPSQIVRIELVSQDGKVIETWEGKELSQLSLNDIHNTYLYNKFETGPYGIIAPVSAKATITLPPSENALSLKQGVYQLQIYTIEGHRFTLKLH